MIYGNMIVSAYKIAGMILTLVLSVGLPISLIVWHARRSGTSSGVVGAFFMGMAGFFVPQICVRIPLLSFISQTDCYKEFASAHFVPYALTLAFTAALFELTGRYGVLKMLQRKELTYQKGIAAGIGHGGIEAMLLVGLSMISNIVIAVIFNNGMADTIKTMVMTSGADEATATASLAQMEDQLVNQPAILFYLGGYERILAIAGHIMMTFVLCHFMMKKQTVKGLIIVLAAHTLFDGTAVIVNGMSTQHLGNVLSQYASIGITYTLLTIYCGIGAVYSLKLYRNNIENIQ